MPDDNDIATETDDAAVNYNFDDEEHDDDEEATPQIIRKEN